MGGHGHDHTNPRKRPEQTLGPKRIRAGLENNQVGSGPRNTIPFLDRKQSSGRQTNILEVQDRFETGYQNCVGCGLPSWSTQCRSQVQESTLHRHFSLLYQSQEMQDDLKLSEYFDHATCRAILKERACVFCSYLLRRWRRDGVGVRAFSELTEQCEDDRWPQTFHDKAAR